MYESIQVYLLMKRHKTYFNFFVKFSLHQTRIGTNILISVNPYKSLSIYDQASIKTYTRMFLSNDSKTQMVGSMPHIFETMARAFHFMTEFHQNQSIIVSGESGSGKTEAVKYALQWLQSTQTQSHKYTNNSMANEMFVAPNEILEAFGNAKV